MTTRLRELTETLHREVPLTGEMGINVAAYDGRELQVTADFEPNVNVHGTAFGGSLFSVCAVASWALLQLKYQEADAPLALSVLGDAHIDYFFPVTATIEAICRLPDEDRFEPFIKRVAEGERAAIELITEVRVGERTAARFRGRYSAFFK